ncbi:MAG: serine/threonine-protein kinase, partial [Myxococcota bacterium]
MTSPGSEPDGRRSDDPENIVGRSIGGRYLVRRCISQGGMGVIYLAQQEALNRDVILKVVRSDRADAEAEARFRREARSLSLLSHPNVVQIFDHGYDEPTGLWFIVMEYVRGITLSSYRRRRGGVIGLDEFVPIARQMLEGVAEAHEHGLVHRDLKPSNVMLTSTDGVRLGVKVVDFGLSKLARSDGETLTRTNFFAGSPLYLAPELIKNKVVDARSDVYALGVIFYQLLSGQNPLQGDDPYQLMFEQVNDGVRPIELALPQHHDLPQTLVRLVNDCLSLSPDDRPANARVVLDRLTVSLSHVVGNPTNAAAAAASGQEYPSDTGTMPVSYPRTNTATGSVPSRLMAARPPAPRTPFAFWLALGAIGSVIVLMFATLGVLVALVVTSATDDPTPTPEPVVAAADQGSDAAEVLRQRALMAVRDGDYDRAVALTTEAMAVAPEDAHLGELLNIVTDLRQRQLDAQPPAPAPGAAALPPEPAPNAEPEVADAGPERQSEPRREPPRARPAPTPRPEGPAVGIAVITSSPAGIPFEIPGIARGETPFRALDVPEGTHDVQFFRDGQVVRTAKITITRGAVELLDVLIEQAPPAPMVQPRTVPTVVAPTVTAPPLPVAAPSGPSRLFVYAPGAAKPRVIQDALTAPLTGTTVTAFGSFRELKDAMATGAPDAVIAPTAVLQALGLPAHLQGRDGSGSTTTRYLL